MPSLTGIVAQRLQAPPGLAPSNPCTPTGVNVTDHGGPILGAVQVAPVFYGSQWQASPVLANLQQDLVKFLNFAVTSSLIALLDRAYGRSATGGPAIGTGTVSKPVNIPSGGGGGTVPDGQIEELTGGAGGSGSPLPAPGPNTLYFYYFEPGITVTRSDGTRSCGRERTDFCGYHWAIQRNPNNLYYAVVPYLPCPNSAGCTWQAGTTTQPLASLTKVSSHELCEAITNPAVNFSPAWKDKNTGDEIGDVCNDCIDVLGGYTVQNEWSQTDSACLLK